MNKACTLHLGLIRIIKIIVPRLSFRNDVFEFREVSFRLRQITLPESSIFLERVKDDKDSGADVSCLAVTHNILLVLIDTEYCQHAPSQSQGSP